MLKTMQSPKTQSCWEALSRHRFGLLVYRFAMQAVLVSGSVALLPMLLVLRRSQAFLLGGASNTIVPNCCTARRTLWHHSSSSSSSSCSDGRRAAARGKTNRRTATLGGDSADAPDDIRQVLDLVVDAVRCHISEGIMYVCYVLRAVGLNCVCCADLRHRSFKYVLHTALLLLLL